jgi:hypothetical protein
LRRNWKNLKENAKEKRLKIVNNECEKFQCEKIGNCTSFADFI